MKTLEQSRRQFIKRAGATALIGVAGLAAGTTALAAESEANDKAASVDEIQWDEEFDAIICGAGAAGLACAVTLATEGNGESVLLVEKGDGPSGNSPFALGTAIWCEDKDLFYKYFKGMQSEYNMAPEDVLQAYVDGVAENKDWLISVGANDDGTLSITDPGAPNADGVGGEWPEIEGGMSIGMVAVGHADETGKAPHVCAWLENQVKTVYADQVDYRVNTPLTAVVQDPVSKEVLGVVIEQDGTERYVKANKGVVLSLGGFESNPEMMQDYVGAGAAIPAAGRMNTGDGITICHKLGADFWHMNNLAGFWMFGRDLADTVDTSPILAKPSPKQYGITVGVNGRRFYMDWDGYMCTTGYEPGSDVTVHVGSRHGHMQFGGEWPHLPMPSKGWFIFDQAGLEAGAVNPDYTTDPVADGICETADTIEELAEKIGVPADELVKTVDTWNGYCETGEDLSFYRPAEVMTSITQAPFYAQLVRPHFLNTDGGPKRSGKGEILDTDGEPIPNLYSAGEFGSVWGNYYQGAGNIAECLIFGRICARSIIAK